MTIPGMPTFGAARSPVSMEGSPVPNVISVKAGWSTSYDRPIWQALNYRRLRFAYRAPSFFLDTFSKGGVPVGYLGIDESLSDRSLAAGLQEAGTITWITCHGEFGWHGYQFDLHAADAPIASLGLGHTGPGPTVLVLDTCYAVDFGYPGWESIWVNSLWPGVRLVLGFASPATIAESTSLRGRTFAELVLSGKALAEAWISAVTEDSYATADVAVAIGFGTTVDDALDVLANASMSYLPSAQLCTEAVAFVSRPT